MHRFSIPKIPPQDTGTPDAPPQVPIPATHRPAESRRPRRGRGAALVIEDDVSVARFFRRSLMAAGFEVTVARSGIDGVAAARQRPFAAVLLDMRLPDLDGLEVLRTLSTECRDSRVVVISGYLTVKTTVEAIRLGASEVLEKPVSEETLLAAVAAAALGRAHAATEPPGVDGLAAGGGEDRSVAHRWACDLMRGCVAPRDSKTLALWAKSAGTSIRMLCERCGMLDIKPHDARDLMRALFAMLKAERERCAPHVLLDIADSRTLQSFRGKAGPDFAASRDLATINRFLDSQRFVDPCNYGVTVLRSQIARLLTSGVS